MNENKFTDMFLYCVKKKKEMKLYIIIEILKIYGNFKCLNYLLDIFYIFLINCKNCKNCKNLNNIIFMYIKIVKIN